MGSVILLQISLYLFEEQNIHAEPFLFFQDAESGVIFISHLPHGFYDRELKAFFSQFGKLSRVSVPRSEKVSLYFSYFFCFDRNQKKLLLKFH